MGAVPGRSTRSLGVIWARSCHRDNLSSIAQSMKSCGANGIQLESPTFPPHATSITATYPRYIAWHFSETARKLLTTSFGPRPIEWALPHSGISISSSRTESLKRRTELELAQMTPNNAFERTVGHRGRPVLAINCVLARAQRRSCLAAQLGR